MTLSFILLVVGLVLLVGGSDLLVRGASALATRAGVSPLVVGLTVVAFGTSTPEVVVNVVAAVHGQTELLFGNVVGSCTINIGFVLALTAIIRPLAVERSVISREIPMLLLAVAAICVLSLDRPLHNWGPLEPGSPIINVLEHGDGIMLLLIFCVFLYYTIMGSLMRRTRDPLIAEVQEEVADHSPVVRPLGIDIALTLAGLLGVAVGGRMTVTGAVGVAEALGVPQTIIGLTLVSFGTTLPELVTCIVASRRGHSDIALGNIVGSCIYNLLFIGGLCATIRAVPIPEGGYIDLLMMAALCAALFPLSLTGQRHIRRLDGALLLAGYLTYAIWRGASALAG